MKSAHYFYYFCSNPAHIMTDKMTDLIAQPQPWRLTYSKMVTWTKPVTNMDTS